MNEISSTGFVKHHLPHQQPCCHEHGDIYFILINFSSFGLNLLYNEAALKGGVRVTLKNYMKCVENRIKDESDESLDETEQCNTHQISEG